MKFDDWWTWDEGDAGAAVDHGHTQKLPDGRHTGDITKAEIKDLKFKANETNPSGTCLVVTWSKATYYPVESIAPLNWRGLIEAICRAAGVTPPRKGEDWDERSLLGKVATIDVENVVAPSGKEYQRVTKWHAGPKPLPEEVKKRPAARTQAQKVTQELASDDIPF
jgi:hypothetical protein